MEKASSSASRHVFSSEELSALEDAYGSGLTATGALMLPKIQLIASQLSLPEALIKNWIRNRNRKRRKGEVEEVDEDAVEGKHLSPFQVYSKLFYGSEQDDNCLSNVSLSERNVAVGRAWRSASEEMIARCKMLSEHSKGTEGLSLTGRQTLINKKLKAIHILMQDLDGLGCAAAFVGQSDPNDYIKVARLDNISGNRFDSRLAWKFMVFLENCKNSSGIIINDQQEWTHTSVKQLFHDKWAEVSRRKLKYTANGKEYTVTGLPNGVKFQRPQDYGKTQLQKIMACKNSIHFILKHP